MSSNMVEERDAMGSSLSFQEIYNPLPTQLTQGAGAH